MKKYGFLLISLTLIAACLVSCEDDNNKADNGIECFDLLPCTDTVNQYCSSSGKCINKKGLGETCARSIECVTMNCDSKLNQCISFNAAGVQKCSASQPCVDSKLYCDLSVNICVDKFENGIPCSKPEVCLSDYCNALGKCDKDPNSDTSCSDLTNPCKDSNKYCESSSGQCVDKKEDGQSCSGDNECITGKCNSLRVCGSEPECTATKKCEDTSRYCDKTTNICKSKKADKAVCHENDECITGNCNSKNECGKELECSESDHIYCKNNDDYCDKNNTCKPKKANGNSCNEGGECLSNWCIGYVCNTLDSLTCDPPCNETTQFCAGLINQCFDKSQNGAECEDEIECLSNYCDETGHCADKKGETPETPKTCSAPEDCHTPKEKCDETSHTCVQVIANDIKYTECQTEGESFCTSDNYLMRCESGFDGSALVYSPSNCGAKKCLENSGEVLCAATCEQEGKTSTDCDPNDERFELQLTCTAVNGGLYAIVTGRNQCSGSATCEAGDNHCF